MKTALVCLAASMSLLAAPAFAQAKKKAAPPAKAEAAPPAASNDQLAALNLADVGDYTCEFNEKIKVHAHPQHTGYVAVEHRSKSYLMRPVLSHTGAIRLEDMRGQMLMIQIATKSMLMDVKIGQRLADGCLRAGDAERVAPASEGLGIDPAKGATAAKPG